MCVRSNKHRHSAYENQSGLCYYCALPMWEDAPDDFARIYKLTIADAMAFQCTAEHLKARCDGGRNSRKNIVAACLYCNQARHRSKEAPSPTDHRRNVLQSRVLQKPGAAVTHS